ncbi:MAG: hypothetical protein J6A54_02955 [Clostridia bacterium]|nr:hypothetical protein [Clostridia bacterium]
MFGYVKPQIPELLVKEYELYKATYCGLCRTMGKRTGCISKMTLNYDFVFLVLLRKVAEGRTGEIKMRRCIAHPLKRRPMLEMDESLEYCAKASVMLTKLKLKDNVRDSKGVKKFFAKMATLVSIFFKKTDKSLRPLEQRLQECIDKLSDYERENTDSVDAVAGVFGDLLSAVASYGLEGKEAEVCAKIGYHLGKWIYIIDALDDISDDAKTGSFNPIINAFGKSPCKEDKDMIRIALMLELSELSKALEMLDFSHHRDVEGVLKNTTYKGMVKQTETLLLASDGDK